MDKEQILKKLRVTNLYDYVIFISQFGDIEKYFIYPTYEEAKLRYSGILEGYTFNNKNIKVSSIIKIE